MLPAYIVAVIDAICDSEYLADLTTLTNSLIFSVLVNKPQPVTVY